MRGAQTSLFPVDSIASAIRDEASSTFVGNMRLPVHRWFRYSAGFSAEWVESVVSEARVTGSIRVLDPFVGAGTVLVVAEEVGVGSWGVEAHPFVFRIARAKLASRSDPEAYLSKIRDMERASPALVPEIGRYPVLIRKCYDDDTLAQLDVLRQAYEIVRDDSPASELAWLTLVGILRRVSPAGTAPWQYVLPKQQKRVTVSVAAAFREQRQMMYRDMLSVRAVIGPRARLTQGDARTCEGVAPGSINLVVTSPPYPNNYDYADATRLEMCFMQEITGWADLQGTVRKHLIRSCS